MNLHSLKAGTLVLPSDGILPNEDALKHSTAGDDVQCELAAGGVWIRANESARERALTLLIAKLFPQGTPHLLEGEATS